MTFQVGDQVRVHYLTQPPVEATVTKEPVGVWVDLRGSFELGEYDFFALAELCELIQSNQTPRRPVMGGASNTGIENEPSPERMALYEREMEEAGERLQAALADLPFDLGPYLRDTLAEAMLSKENPLVEMANDLHVNGTRVWALTYPGDDRPESSRRLFLIED